MKSLSHVRVFATRWTVARQASPSMGFFRQEYWSELPFPSPWDLPNPGIEPGSPALQADALSSESLGKPHGNMSLRQKGMGISLVVQRLTLCAPKSGGTGLIPGQGTRSHEPQQKILSEIYRIYN